MFDVEANMSITVLSVWMLVSRDDCVVARRVTEHSDDDNGDNTMMQTQVMTIMIVISSMM